MLYTSDACQAAVVEVLPFVPALSPECLRYSYSAVSYVVVTLPPPPHPAPPHHHHLSPPHIVLLPLQWPALLRPLSQLNELPAMVLERYSAVQTVCFCGAFPEIGRAWATMDNTLFLWRFDRWCA